MFLRFGETEESVRRRCPRFREQTSREVVGVLESEGDSVHDNGAMLDERVVRSSQGGRRQAHIIHFGD